MHLLAVRDLTRHFGGVRAVEEVSFSIRPGVIWSIIGPNGAGKTTLFNCLSGFIKPTRGGINFSGSEIAGLGADRITRLGISRTFQNIRLFREMTVLDNVLAAQHSMLGYGLLSSVLRTSGFRAAEREAREKAYEYLELLGLEDTAEKPSGSLPYGVQRKIEIARALATGASLMLLDEPAAGMNPSETAELMDVIKNIREMGRTVLLIEHDMKLVMEISDGIMVLDHGVKIAEGTPSEIKGNHQVIEAYLGKETPHHAEI